MRFFGFHVFSAKPGFYTDQIGTSRDTKRSRFYRISVQSNLIKGRGIRAETQYFTFYDVGGIQRRKKYRKRKVLWRFYGAFNSAPGF